MLASGQLDVTPILNRVAPLTDWKTSFDDMDNGKVVKVVLKP
jgi:threonine dehydrogenase-like Zn-dependent dehydrogenase